MGNTIIRVLHTPGHTQDCICLLDEDNGVLFGGHTINTGPIYAQLEDSDVKAFARFQQGIGERCEGPPVATELREVGSFRFFGAREQ